MPENAAAPAVLPLRCRTPLRCNGRPCASSSSPKPSAGRGDDRDHRGRAAGPRPVRVGCARGDRADRSGRRVGDRRGGHRGGHDSRGRRPGLSAAYLLGHWARRVRTRGRTADLPLLLVGTVLVGFASAANIQARYAATDLAEPGHRARALSTVVWATTVGAVLGPNLAGPGSGSASSSTSPGWPVPSSSRRSSSSAPPSSWSCGCGPTRCSWRSRCGAPSGGGRWP